jgi:hypothetical protein
MDNESNNLGDIFDKHLEFEFDKEDVDATMTTMTEDPYVHNVPTLTGGSYQDNVSGIAEVVELVGSSEKSWADAAQIAVNESLDWLSNLNFKDVGTCSSRSFFCLGFTRSGFFDRGQKITQTSIFNR